MPSALESLPVLVVDCQSTGPNPRRGHLLELAWALTSASNADPADDEIHCSLVALPAGEEIPPRITALTGITAEQLAAAADPSAAWSELAATIDALPGRQNLWAVAHFARFEEPFLADLHRRFGKGAFPLRMLCTREAFRRVAPELPRHGLRALAGHLGHPLPEQRRSAGHVRATARIWRELCHRLGRQGIVDIEGLLQLLAAPPPRRAEVARAFPLSAERRRSLADRPGVYRFVDPTGRVLYVGKAASLRQRVASYYQPRGYRLASTLEMLTQAFDVDVTETATRVEAALLEVDEIRRLDPPYNTALRARREPTPPSELLEAIARAVDDPETALDNAALLGLAYPEQPDLDVVRAGVDLLREVVFDGHAPTPIQLSAIGATIWWRRYREEGTEGTERTEDVEPQSDPCPSFAAPESTPPNPQTVAVPPAWSPGRVARALLRTAIHAAHLQRREIWQRLIGSSTITWRSREESGRDHVLTVDRGAMPDRLRVLTTELRRLVVDDRLVEIRIAPDVGVTPERARALLEWI